MTKRYLSGRDFEAALAVFAERGITEYRLCKLLDVSFNQPRRWCELGAPRYIALAITAILEDRPPWKPGRRKK